MTLRIFSLFESAEDCLSESIELPTRRLRATWELITTFLFFLTCGALKDGTLALDGRAFALILDTLQRYTGLVL